MRRARDLIKDYPDEALLEEVQRVSELVDRPFLTTRDFSKHSAIDSATLRRRFGSWRIMLERAGLVHMYAGQPECLTGLGNRYSDEELVEEVRRVAEIVGKPKLLVSDFEQHSRMSREPLMRRFGKWRAVLERAGIGHMYLGRSSGLPVGPRVADEHYLEELRRVAEIVGKPWLSDPDFQKHSKILVQSITKRFGGWRAALERAGLGHMYTGNVEGYKRPKRVKYSDEMLLDEVGKVAGIVGKPKLGMVDFQRNSEISLAVLCKRFGGWRNVLERAGVGHMYVYQKTEGYKRPQANKYSDEMLLDEVRRVAGIAGRQYLSSLRFEKHSKISSTIPSRRFGGWRNVLKHAGLGHMYEAQSSGYSDERVVEEVRRVARLVDKPVLTISDFRKHSQVNPRTLRDKLGGWRAVLERAGVGDMYIENVEGYHTLICTTFSEEELLDEIRRVARLAGKSPLTTIEFKKYSSFSPETFGRRFGGWYSAWERAGCAAESSVKNSV